MMNKAERLQKKIRAQKRNRLFFRAGQTLLPEHDSPMPGGFKGITRHKNVKDEEE